MEFTFKEKLAYHLNRGFGMVTCHPEWWFTTYVPFALGFLGIH